MTDPSVFDRLQQVMAQLRDPDHGCPWDRQQTFASLVPFTLEEAFEVAEAVAQGDPDALRDELADLLLQVLFHGQIAREQGLFDLTAIAEHLEAKLIRRHPHVFGDQQGADLARIKDNWEQIKRQELDAAGRSRDSLMDGVPAGLPALARAAKLQKKARRVGFDWPEAGPVLEQVRAELQELEQAMVLGQVEAMEDELGDVLFTLVNLSRHLNLDPELALRRASGKFERRFRHMEGRAAEQGVPLEEQTPQELEQGWQWAKRQD